MKYKNGDAICTMDASLNQIISEISADKYKATKKLSDGNIDEALDIYSKIIKKYSNYSDPVVKSLIGSIETYRIRHLNLGIIEKIQELCKIVRKYNYPKAFDELIKIQSSERLTNPDYQDLVFEYEDGYILCELEAYRILLLSTNKENGEQIKKIYKKLKNVKSTYTFKILLSHLDVSIPSEKEIFDYYSDVIKKREDAYSFYLDFINEKSEKKKIGIVVHAASKSNFSIEKYRGFLLNIDNETIPDEIVAILSNFGLQGDDMCCYKLAQYYYEGPAAKRDEKIAAKWARFSINYPLSRKYLFKILWESKTKRSKPELFNLSYHWYKKGDEYAGIYLSKMYGSGTYVSKNYTESIHILAPIAEKNIGWSRKDYLTILIENGDECKFLECAKRWAEQGCLISSDILKKVQGNKK